MSEPIEFIYFDLGNVVLHFDHQQGCRNLGQLANVTADQVREIVFDSGLQYEYESGQIETDEFTDRFNAAAGSNVDTQRVCHALSDVFSLNREIMPLLTQLCSSGIPIALLSNTCQAHWEFAGRRFSILPKLFSRFENVLSFEINAMKPNLEIYQHAIKLANVAPERIFFVDDRQENIDSGLKMRLQACLFSSTLPLIRSLEKLNVKINL